MNKKNIIVGLLMMIMMTGTAIAECNPEALGEFQQCYGCDPWSYEWITWCHVYDFNQDFAINLYDLGYFAQNCMGEYYFTSNKEEMKV